MPRVNDAKGATKIQWGREGTWDTGKKAIPVNKLGLPMETNCALATAAGVCNLASLAVVETTGSVAAHFNRPQNNSTMTPGDGGLSEQAQSIFDYCSAHPALAGRKATCWGSSTLPMTGGSALGMMNGMPVGTVFAVSVEGKVPGINLRKGATSPHAVHWLSAMREASGLTFYDFQTDWANTEFMAMDGPVQVTSRPVPTCLGRDFAGDTQIFFIAFEPT